jgi:serine/threonine protein kinase
METATAAPHAPAGVSALLAALARAPERRGPAGWCDRFRPGEVVGGLELRRELGRGGFGVVFEAHDRERDRLVAVKTIRPGAPSAPARESLEREVAAGRLRHPNIVTVLAGGRCARGPFVVFEMLQGETVAERLQRGAMAAGEAIAVAISVTRALAHAHARGVLHRDVKPANVFLPASGEAKLIDFGLAHGCGSAGPSGSGTSGYMAPEQRSGSREDARTDLFSLGLLIHEMTTGRRLLDAGGAHTGARSTRAAVPPALERLVADLVEREPARRPPSAAVVLRRLQAARAAVARRRRAAGEREGER